MKSYDEIPFVTGMQPYRPNSLSTARNERRLTRQAFKIANSQPMFISYHNQGGINKFINMDININLKPIHNGNFNSFIIFAIGTDGRMGRKQTPIHGKEPPRKHPPKRMTFHG